MNPTPTERLTPEQLAELGLGFVEREYGLLVACKRQLREDPQGQEEQIEREIQIYEDAIMRSLPALLASARALLDAEQRASEAASMLDEWAWDDLAELKPNGFDRATAIAEVIAMLKGNAKPVAGDKLAASEQRATTAEAALAQARDEAGRYREALVNVLRQLEWVPCLDTRAKVHHECPSCRSVKAVGHSPNCQLAAALAGKVKA